MSLKLDNPPLARFKNGDPVCVDDRPPEGHCRTPWYLRGKSGVIVEPLGCFRDPERLAYHKPGFPGQHLYTIRFKQTDLWPQYAGPAGDHLETDLTENWLFPI
jgi:nitrile hydratase subunit beta